MQLSNSIFALWQRDRGNWLLAVYDRKLNARVRKWSFARLTADGFNHYLKQYIIPSSKIRWVMSFLGTPVTKNPNRVKAGKAAAQIRPINRGQIKQKVT